MTYGNISTILSDRDEMTDGERELFLADAQAVFDEYFERDGSVTLDVTKTENGYSVCVIFDARRIKRFKKPL